MLVYCDCYLREENYIACMVFVTLIPSVQVMSIFILGIVMIDS